MIAAMLATAFLCQGITAPFEKDEESRPAGLIRDIVQHGNWLVPADDYREPSRKPPLYYWLSAIAAKASGGVVDEARARAIAVASAVAVAVAAMAFSGAFLGETGGWLAFLFLLGIYGFSARAAYARTDMLFSALLFGAWCALYSQIEGEARPGRTFVAGLLMGLAILTKGPLALVLCGFAVVIYLILSGRNPLRLLREGWVWQTLGVALAIAALWYVPAFLSAGDLLSTQFGQENLGHFLPAQLGGTGEAARPFYYIAARIVGTSLPVSLFIPALAVALLDGPVWAQTRRPILYQLSIVLAVLMVFSLATSKRDVYMLPALPSLAILLAGLFTVVSGLGAGYGRRLWDVAGVVLATAASAIVVGAVFIDRSGALPGAITVRLQSSDAAYAALFVDGITNWHWRFIVFVCASCIAAIAISFALIRRRPMWAATGVALMSIAGVSLWIGALRPELARSRSLKDFAAQVQSIVGDRNVYVLGGMEYELSFYLGRGVPVWNPAKADAVPNPPYYLVASGEEFAKLKPEARAGLSILAQTQSPLRRSQMMLLKVDKVPLPRPAAADRKSSPGKVVVSNLNLGRGQIKHGVDG